MRRRLTSPLCSNGLLGANGSQSPGMGVRSHASCRSGAPAPKRSSGSNGSPTAIITPAESAELITLLETLEIDVDGETPSRAFTRVLDLAREERLTAYDAAYLERAMRLGIPLASKDADLCDAAERLGVSIVRAA